MSKKRQYRRKEASDKEVETEDKSVEEYDTVR